MPSNDRFLLKHFFNCGDDSIIKFAIARAHLNKREKEVMRLVYDECMTQDDVAECMNYSTRMIQEIYYAGADKLLAIPWVVAYSKELCAPKK